MVDEQNQKYRLTRRDCGNYGQHEILMGGKYMEVLLVELGLGRSKQHNSNFDKNRL